MLFSSQQFYLENYSNSVISLPDAIICQMFNSMSCHTNEQSWTNRSIPWYINPLSCFQYLCYKTINIYFQHFVIFCSNNCGKVWLCNSFSFSLSLFLSPFFRPNKVESLLRRQTFESRKKRRTSLIRKFEENIYNNYSTRHRPEGIYKQNNENKSNNPRRTDWLIIINN